MTATERLLVPVEVLCDERLLRAYRQGHVAGWLEGVLDAQAHDAAAHRRIAAMIRDTASWPERDVTADERRAERSAAYWAGRRGEGGAA